MKVIENYRIVIAIIMIYLQLTRTIDPPAHAKIRIQYSTRSKFLNDNLTKVQFSANNKNITLNLKKSFLIGSKTPVWLMNREYYDVPIEKTDPYTIGKAVQFYIDEDKNCSIAVTTDNYGEMKFIGVIGKWHIRPVRNCRSYNRKLRSINQKKEFPKDVNSSVGVFFTDYHIISRISDAESIENVITLPLGTRKHSNPNSWGRHIYKREARDTPIESTLHPRVLIIADYNIKFSNPSESRFYNLLMYIVIFWNSVDLRFRGLTDPGINLHIAGIIVAMDYKSVPFFRTHLDGGALKVGWAKNEMGDWLYTNKRKFPIESYNIAIAMTKLPLCLTDASGHCGSTRVTGMAKGIGVICTSNWASTVGPTVIINDYLDFSGILRATHEMGHLFGADHDGSEGNEDCDNSKNLMATTDEYDKSRHIWSRCSQRSISKFLKSTEADCLRKMIPVEDRGDSILQTTSLLDQCNVRGYTHACDPTPETCKSLECHYSGLTGFFTAWQCIGIGPALEGSPCRLGFCRNNSCVPSTNPIPGDFGNGQF